MIAPLESILFLTVPSMIHPLETSEFSTSAVSLKRVGGVSFTFVFEFYLLFLVHYEKLLSYNFHLKMLNQLFHKPLD